MLGVAFALRGTLVADRGLARAAIEQLVAEAVARDASDRSALSAQDVATRILARGSQSANDVGRELAHLVPASSAERAARSLGARYRQISAARVAEYLVPRTGASETLAELSRLAIPTAILTGAISGVAIRAAALLDFQGHVLATEDIGAAKPSPGAYAALARAFGLRADEIYYVSSDPGDIAAARACGLSTVYLDELGHGPPRDAHAPLHTIASLPALLPILAAPYTRGVLSIRHVLRSALAWRPGHFVSAHDDDIARNDD